MKDSPKVKRALKTYNEKSNSDPPAGPISSRAISGSAIIVIGRMAVKAIDLVVLLILARLLSQADFGLIGLAMTFVVVLETVLDIPLNQVLLKEKTISDEMIDTVFTLSVIRGIILAVALCLLSVPISWAYGEPRLILLTCVLSLAPAFRGARSPAMIFYLRRMDFKWDIVNELSGKIIAGVACVGIAATTGSYWALVAGVVLSPVALNLVSYGVAPHRPRFSLSQWHRFSSFTSWMTVSQIGRALTWQFDKLLLGAFLGPATFGRYSVAKDLSNTSQQAIVPPLLKPLASAYSVAHHDAKHLGSFFIKSAHAILLIVGPIFLGLAVLSDHVVLIALGESWEQTGWILRWFSVSAIFAAVHRPVESLALVLDKNKELAIGRIWTILIRIPMILVGCVMYSYQGAVAALVISEVFACLLMLALGCRLVDVKLPILLAKFRGPIAAMLLMGICLIALTPDAHSTIGWISLSWQSMAAGAAAVTVYVVSVLSFWCLEGAPAGLEKSIVTKLASFRKSTPEISRAS